MYEVCFEASYEQTFGSTKGLSIERAVVMMVSGTGLGLLTARHADIA